MQPIRPKNLNLFTIQFPIPAIVSILHRISGFILFLLIPPILWVLNYSLQPEGFAWLRQKMSLLPVQLFIWLLLIPFVFHLVAGIRHLLMDIHIGETLKGGRLTAWLTFVVTAILILFAGIWLW